MNVNMMNVNMTSEKHIVGNLKIDVLQLITSSNTVSKLENANNENLPDCIFCKDTGKRRHRSS